MPFPAHRLFARLFAAVLACLALSACGGEPPTAAVPLRAVSAPAGAEAPSAAEASATEAVPYPLGEGFVVWESNRGGAWRLWAVDLAPGSRPRQVSPDEPGRVHCCPHLSPDGTRLAFLSLPPGGEAYQPGRTTGPLHLLDLATGEVGVLAPAARTYFENRAVVWRGDDELVFIDGEGRSRLLDLTSGESRPLTDRALDAGGWLIGPALDVATRGRPSFSPYDAERRLVLERPARGGCQPYFSADGRWGYWVAGAGGPINRLDLASDEVSTILAKGDPRTVDGHGYAYFPMFSADGRAFAFAASRGEHSHVDADYEVFVAAADPSGLEIVGAVRRITEHPATDRFPDVHLAPQALGSHFGEVPFRVELEVPAGGDWRWSFGDGATARGSAGRHVYSRPGLYRVEARRDDLRLTGSVSVRPAAPPRVVARQVLDGGRELRLTFDEEIDVDEATVAFADDREILSWSLVEDGRSLLVRPRAPLERGARLDLAGIRDRAEPPNLLTSTRVDVEPPAWPARRDAIFVWRTADEPVAFFDQAAEVHRSGVLTPEGRAFLDREHRMAVRGGRFSVGDEEGNRLRWALQSTNEMALELTFEPAAGERSEEGALAVFGRPGQPHNFALLDRGGELFYSQRVDSRGPGALVETSLGRPGTGRRHLVLSYAPGRLTLDVDGERVVESEAIQGDFFHWRSVPLSFGGRAGGGLAWRGAIEGVALYDRVLSATEARESHARYRRILERRVAPPELVVEARLEERCPTPSLADIRPYREALAVHRYAVERVLSGAAPAGPLRVAHWELLDGERQPAADRRAGDRVTLRLEPFDAQPQLESAVVSSCFDQPPDFFAVDGD